MVGFAPPPQGWDRKHRKKSAWKEKPTLEKKKVVRGITARKGEQKWEKGTQKLVTRAGNREKARQKGEGKRRGTNPLHIEKTNGEKGGNFRAPREKRRRF